MAKDKTLKDNNRRALSLQDYNSVSEVLPSYFAEEYPKLISFLDAYYEFEMALNEAQDVYKQNKTKSILGDRDDRRDESDYWEFDFDWSGLLESAFCFDRQHFLWPPPFFLEPISTQSCLNHLSSPLCPDI